MDVLAEAIVASTNESDAAQILQRLLEHRNVPAHVRPNSFDPLLLEDQAGSAILAPPLWVHSKQLLSSSKNTEPEDLLQYNTSVLALQRVKYFHRNLEGKNETEATTTGTKNVKGESSLPHFSSLSHFLLCSACRPMEFN